MFGYEPRQPKLWKAVLTAALIVFPFLYLLDVAMMHHQPGWLYVLIAATMTGLLAYQMYAGVGKWGLGKAATTLVTPGDENAIWPTLGQSQPADLNDDTKNLD